MKEIFFDNNSTTKPYPIVAKIMKNIMNDCYGNASTSYDLGKKSKEMIEESRKKICELLDIKKEEQFIFTSGATESNNMVIRGCVERHVLSKTKPNKNPVVLCSAIEHASVYQTCKDLECHGSCEVKIIPVDKNGVIINEIYEKMVTDENPMLVCVMIANNEIGTIQNIKYLCDVLHKKNDKSFFFCDATQYVGKYMVSFHGLGVDGASFSGHKFNGPKGIGGLYLKEPKHIETCVTGGPQENNIRAGTENTHSIVGMTIALFISCENMEKNKKKIEKMRDYIKTQLTEKIPDVKFNADVANKLHNTINVTLPINGQKLMKKMNENKIYVNVGSACSKGKKSRVLNEIGLKEKDVENTLRISIGVFNKMKECEKLVEKIVECCGSH